jgi:hypothetical protein
MTTLKVKSIVFILITIFAATALMAQDSRLENDYTDKEEYFTGQKRRALKINFIGNFWGTTKISYEQVVEPGKSLELKATIVDAGQQSFFGSVGYKFYKKPSFIAPGMQRRNVLEGTYFKPEIFFGMSKEERLFENDSERKPALGLVLNLGKQWMIGEVFTIDAYVGTGVGTGNHLRGYFGNGGLILTGGLNFGFAF